MSPDRRIFLNIIATYARSLYALVIGLFCGRWTLMALGQTDYGIMGVVAGLVAFMTYLNGSLGNAVARFYAVSVGREATDPERGLEECRMWFTTAVILHTLLPLALVLVGEPLGEYAVRHWLTIPSERMVAAVWVWRYSCVACCLGMMSVPMTALYTAHQRIAELTVYSFVATTLNALFLAYMVSHPGEWLTRFALWTCLVTWLPNLLIAGRAFALFPECRFRWKGVRFRGAVRELGGYAFWSVTGSAGTLLRDHGSTLFINVFFGPIVNAGAAVGITLAGQCNALSLNTVGPFSPAISTAWGAGDRERTNFLCAQTSKLGTLVMLVIGIPLALEADEVLRLWLRDPPAYASAFCLCALAMNVLDRLAAGQGMALDAKGRIAAYQALGGLTLALSLPLAWVLMRLGCGPCAVGLAMVLTMLLCILERVIFARVLVGLSICSWLRSTVCPLLLISLLSVALGILPRLSLSPSFPRIVLTTLLVESVLLPLSFRFLLTPSDRTSLLSRLRHPLQK